MDFCKAVTTMTSDPAFAEKHKSKSAPLAMVAFANEVQKKIIEKRKTNDYFENGIIVEVPCVGDEAITTNNPQHHSIIGHKLLHVNWERSHGLQVPCPDATCRGILDNDRSNFSKNKTLFPIFSIEDSPTWCIVMSLTYKCCHRRFYANEWEVLVNLPDHVAQLYPVDTIFSFNNFACHLSRSTTDVFSSIMLTYGNGELCSKMLYNTLNRSCLRKLKACCSAAKAMEKNPRCPPADCLAKDSVFIKTYPPLGDTLRDMRDAAMSSRTNPWRISDVCECYGHLHIKI